MKKILKNTKEYSVALWRHLRNDRMYRLIGIVFAVTIFYNVVIVPDEKEKKTKNASVKVEDIFKSPDLDRVNVSKVYKNILHAGTGEYYRIFVRAIAQNNARVDVYAHSSSGARQFIGTMDMTAGVWSKSEFVVQMDGLYENILFERQDNGSVWYENKIILSEPELSKISTGDRWSILALTPTIINKPKTVVAQIESSQLPLPFVDNAQQACVPFVAKSKNLSSVSMRLFHVGDGGSGAYTVTIEKLIGTDNMEAQIVGSKTIKLTNISTHAIEKGSDVYRFFMPTTLKKDTNYVICIDNKEAQTNLNNHMVIKSIVKDGSVAFAMEYVVVEDDNLLIGARIEDRGSSYRMLYDFKNGGEEEIFNVFASSEDSARYSQNRKTVFVPNSREAFMDYRINTKHPFQALHAYLRLNNADVRKYTVLYSYDRETWLNVINDDKSGRDFDFVIAQGNDTEYTHIYVRIKSKRDAKKIKGRLEIREFEVTAYMNK